LNLCHRPWTEQAGRSLDGRHEIGPGQPLIVHDLFGVGTQHSGIDDRGAIDRAGLVLDETVRIGSGVAEVGQHGLDIDDLHTEFFIHTTVNGSHIGLARSRMAAARV